MSAINENDNARVHARTTCDCLLIELGGRWRITAKRPDWSATIGGMSPERIRFDPTALGVWDSSLVLYVYEAFVWAQAHAASCELGDLPAALRELVLQLDAAKAAPAGKTGGLDLFTSVGLAATDVWRKASEMTVFIGEAVISMTYLLKRPHKFRWRDCLEEMQKCGAMALPIVGLINGLVGVTLAYIGAVVLRQFGADIWVADLVGLSMVREMGPVMTAIVLAGRTGAAYAAHLGNMKANEEIDAFYTLGIRPIDFLVMPRLVALGLMMPLLAIYGNALGVLGGMGVSFFVLDIPPAAYWVELQTIIDMSDMCTGLIKAASFGVLVGLAGCLRGLQAERSAAGVGAAATSAVVTGILLIIVTDSLFAVIFDMLGW